MTETSGTHWIAECYWPDVHDDELSRLGQRVARASAELAGAGGPASYLGRLRVIDDDVVLFLFEGSIGAVRQVTDQAGIHPERILRCVPDLRPSIGASPVTDLSP